MVVPSSAPAATARGGRVIPPINSSDSAQYTRDLLQTLTGIAVRQDHMVLVRLLEAAAREAERVARM